MHYYIIIIIIAIIVIWQFVTFSKTVNLLNVFKSIFCNNKDEYNLLNKVKIESIESATDSELDDMLEKAGFDSQKYHYTRFSEESGEILYFRREAAKKDLQKKYENDTGFSAQNNNPIYQEIETSINSYLESNKSGISDFSLMKDIVDRNCDAAEEEINTQIPIPLYLGLVGTMVGILVGIGHLWISGGLSDLLNIDSSSSGMDGIEALLGGVALAMISSILGILLTTFGSLRAKNVKAEVEKRKHVFLSWIQKELLPSLKSDVSGALIEMSRNLQSFNSTFSTNTSDFGKALSQVNESYQLQTQLLNAVKQIADKEVSLQNIQLYNALKNSTEEIGTLAQYLNNTTQYLANVKVLNEKLDNYENRTQFIEHASKFYAKHENWLTENIEMANRSMRDSVEKYDKSVSETLGKIQENLEIQMRNFADILQKQQEKLGEKTKEIDKVIDELRNLSAIKDSISKFESATKEQNKKIDRLTESIEKLAQMKSSGGVVQQKMPRMMKIAIITGCSIMSLAGLSYLIIQIVNWISELIRL